MPSQKTSKEKTSEEGSERSSLSTEVEIEPSFTEYEHYKRVPYSIKFFELDTYRLGENDEFDEWHNRANSVEKWARSQVKTRGLEDTLEVYDFLIQEVSDKLGVSPHTNKLMLLDTIYDHIQKGNKPDTRAKMRKIRESLLKQSEESKQRLKIRHQREKKSLEEELSKAMQGNRKLKREIKDGGKRRKR